MFGFGFVAIAIDVDEGRFDYLGRFPTKRKAQQAIYAHCTWFPNVRTIIYEAKTP